MATCFRFRIHVVIVFKRILLCRFVIRIRHRINPATLSDHLILTCQCAINYFNPRVWFLENPQTGLLKDRSFMSGIPFCDVDYCCYCDWGYRKGTRLWNNVDFNIFSDGATHQPKARIANCWHTRIRYN